MVKFEALFALWRVWKKLSNLRQYLDFEGCERNYIIWGTVWTVKVKGSYDLIWGSVWIVKAVKGNCLIWGTLNCEGCESKLWSNLRHTLGCEECERNYLIGGTGLWKMRRQIIISIEALWIVKDMKGNNRIWGTVWSEGCKRNLWYDWRYFVDCEGCERKLSNLRHCVECEGYDWRYFVDCEGCERKLSNLRHCMECEGYDWRYLV
jgi:hypothetical protein